MEIILLGLLNGVLLVWLRYKSQKYQELLAKHKIVVNELCDYLDAEEQEESEWGNKR